MFAKLLLSSMFFATVVSATVAEDSCIANGGICACSECKKDPIFGRWAADLPGEKFDPAVWFSISRDGGGRMHVSMLWRWGILQYPECISYSNGEFRFRQQLRGAPKGVTGNRYILRKHSHFKWFVCKVISNDELEVRMQDLNYFGQPVPGENYNTDLGSFVCRRIPDPGPAPDLNSVVYGEPIDLLKNGMDDWEPVPTAKSMPNLWSCKDGVLANEHKTTPNGDWVSGCNIMSKRRDFGDCKLSFDFRMPEYGNSGVWIRGNYEINVCDSYGWAIDNRNSGILCGLFEPLCQAEKPHGEWQHIDVWFVNRHCTTILNGKIVEDNVPVYGVTGGAFSSDVLAKGPLKIQGDHSGAEFRNMILTPIISAQDAVEPGYTRIFNGRNLDGWVGARDLYYVENGELVFKEGDKNFGNLFYEKKFANFNARFQFKLVPNGNNGFAIRAGDECVNGGALIGGNKILTDAGYNGMEIQILDDTGSLKQKNKAWQYCGSIYGVCAAQKGHLRPVGEWNDYDITADGDRITVILNGVTILATSIKDLPTDGSTPDGKAHPGLHATSGYIGFLGHTMPVRFRNIRIKEIK